MSRGRSAVFLDRDGVLNVYLPGDYVKRPDELRLIPGAARGVRALNEAGLPAFVISNQQGVAKGLMTGDDLVRVDAALHDALGRLGARVERSYYCPHAAADACACRKPKAGLILQAAEEHDLDLAGSFFVGDTETDQEAARAAGVGTFVLVLTGKHPHAAASDDRALFATPPDHVSPDLAAAAAWIAARVAAG
uniref:D,D-heptose 1,7-bisphosphate phosphatase n=1 Tax=uncultured Armatimonadetes bacterium TaxID=157466 RepID=A0A6J4HWX4_9BACT|nr:hypothetical protein AVDCRST_MAG63-1207 [uncultured Armatimonadetes bacterium]